jgi:adenosylcobinamide kinase/adenosylcobinamide-phosphate guanylyltransferase
MRARASGLTRRPGRVLIDGTLEFTPYQQVMTGTGRPGEPAHHIAQLAGGFDITSPDGGRLLLSAGPGEIPEPAPGARPYDIALLDLLASPVQLGRLRAAGLIGAHTTVAAVYADHRISSEEELARRCELWCAAACEDGQLVASPAPGIPAVIPAPGAAAARPHRTLILGGARSGKSTEAELRLAAEPSVTYLAAGPWAGPAGEGDTEWPARVARHRARRPPWWRTVESLDIAGQLRQETGAVLIDGIGTWLAGVMDEVGMWATDPPGGGGSAELLTARVDDLIEAWRQTAAIVVAVTDQVGSGLVPPYPAGRAFRDQLGWLNQRLAAESEVNVLVVAGQVTTLPG